MSRFLEVLVDYTDGIECDDRLSPAEQALVDTITTALFAMQAGTTVEEMYEAVLAEDAAFERRRAAKAKREKANKRRAKARAAGSRSSQIGKRRPTGKVKKTVRRATA